MPTAIVFTNDLTVITERESVESMIQLLNRAKANDGLTTPDGTKTVKGWVPVLLKNERLVFVNPWTVAYVQEVKPTGAAQVL